MHTSGSISHHSRGVQCTLISIDPLQKAERTSEPMRVYPLHILGVKLFVNDFDSKKWRTGWVRVGMVDALRAVQSNNNL